MAVKLTDIKTIANNSTLLHRNKSEVQLNVDPTETSGIRCIGGAMSHTHRHFIKL